MKNTLKVLIGIAAATVFYPILKWRSDALKERERQAWKMFIKLLLKPTPRYITFQVISKKSFNRIVPNGNNKNKLLKLYSDLRGIDYRVEFVMSNPSYLFGLILNGDTSEFIPLMN